MSVKIHRITNANVYVGGSDLMGQAGEIKLPDITAKMSEYNGLGLVGTFELPDGFEKMDGSIKWNSFYPSVANKAMNPFTAVQLMARSNVEQYSPAGKTGEVALVTIMTVMFKKYSLGTFKQNENTEFDSEFSATSIKQTIDGEPVIELDFMSNTFMLGGEDQLKRYKQNM